VSGDAGLHRAHNQGWRNGGDVSGKQGQPDFGVACPPERGREPLQLRAQWPGRVRLDDGAESLQRAADPPGGNPHLVHGVWLIAADQRVIV